MNRRAPDLTAVLELEARHEDLLARLDELDKRVEQVLREWQGSVPATEPAGS